ncbi:hypothetical protein B0J15DRAFT_550492 [Fusarium solani]|uniref:Uncharacterized protein n=1 Tax=Fusarium solani TaxID=169388 RepID=A0A9P9H3X7_FUSSL|nr:uncharacterized protein B0J15DRAFT_550492 [Fusarium solani]KAH7250720.1 hypothetical protein B0J15DRAFT_550492 [Fusarium solani]
MSSRPSYSKPQGVSKCRYTTSALPKGTATLQKGITRGTMADDENTKTQAEEDRLLMPPPPRPATRRTRSSPKKASPQKTAEFTMKLRPRKNKNKDKPEPVATTTDTDTNTGTDATDANDNTDTKKPEDDTKESEDDTKKPEDEDLPPLKPLNWRERLLFPGIMPTPEEVELWRELAPQAGDRMLTVDEVDKLCEEFYKESRE